MTQIFNLPQIDGSQTVFTVTKGSVFSYSIVFPNPFGPQVPLVAAATMSAGSATLSNLPTAIVASLVTGQPVSGYGIPAGAVIAAIPTATTVTLSIAATQSGALVGVTFQVLPLDLTGISFRQQIRQTADPGDTWAIIELSTANGLLISGGTSGTLSGLVLPSALTALPIAPVGAPLVTDIVATASDGGPINLMAQNGPASVVVLQGVTR